MMTYKIKLIWIILIFVLIALAFPSLIPGRSNLPNAKISVIRAKMSTPLYALSHTDRSAPMPMMRVIYGKDKNGKELAVFIDRLYRVRGYVYLDDGISSEKAAVIALEAAQFKGAIKSLKLGWSGYFFWFMVAENETDLLQAVIDFKTGQIINTQKNSKRNN